MNQSPAIRRPLLARMGVDVGYGHTKLAMESMPDPSAAQPVTSAAQGIRPAHAHVTVFPSTVILSRGTIAHGGVLGNHAHDCVHDGVAAYLVGDSAIDADDGASARSLDAQFANSNEYSILLKACLKHRNYPMTVERLVLGVPFDRMQSAAGILKQRFTGTQRVDHYECDVRSVQVVAQPVAAFIWQLHLTGQRIAVEKYTCLTVDIGYRTIDWAATRGLRLIDPRCGSSPGGVHRLVREVADQLSALAGEDCTSLAMRARIELALRQKDEFIEVGIRRFMMSHFRPSLDRLIEQSLLPLVESIGTATDVTEIWAVGGGCELYAPALVRRFPNKRVICAAQPQFAIARGLQLLADRAL